MVLMVVTITIWMITITRMLMMMMMMVMIVMMIMTAMTTAAMPHSVLNMCIASLASPDQLVLLQFQSRKSFLCECARARMLC